MTASRTLQLLVLQTVKPRPRTQNSLGATLQSNGALALRLRGRLSLGSRLGSSDQIRTDKQALSWVFRPFQECSFHVGHANDQKVLKV